MPARSERIYIFPYKNGGPGWVMPFPAWWDRSEFIARYQKREIDLGNPIDANYVYVLNSAEALAWNNECLQRSTGDPLLDRQPPASDRAVLHDRLQQSQWLLVESYEWESGMS